MKKYSVSIIDKNSNELIDKLEELSNTKSYLLKKYKLKYMFTNQGCTINVNQLFKKTGKQMNIFDIIKD
jgi:hypothetical protein